ncbi:MAG TPA: enolase C-terminal domain-like protein [Polyangiaceae bacterium]
MIRSRRLLEFRRPLAEPMASAAGTWNERRGLLLVVEDGDGHFGLGEAAPLPGYSKDTLEDARAALLALPANATRLEPQAAPAAHAALEAAYLDLRARTLGRPAWTLQAPLAESPEPTEGTPAALALSQWLPGDPERARDAARRSFERNVRWFKVKLEPGSDAGLVTLRALREEYGARVTLSADANGSLSVQELEHLLPELRRLSLAWIEEPAREPLTGPIGVPLALDESLQAGTPDFARAKALGVAALMLKPTALGGLLVVYRLAQAAARNGIGAVASHTLEGPVGFMTAATLALSLGARFAHGLGPHSGLGGIRPPALHPERDELVAWREPGFGIGLETALAGADVVREERF